MKVCKSCSAYNSDDRSHCVDCGEKLGKPLSEDEAAQLEETIRQHTDRLYNGEDPLFIGWFDKIVGMLSLLGLAALGVLWIGGFVQADLVRYAWISLGLFLVGLVESLFPKLVWELEELRLSLFTDHAMPGGLYRILRRGGEGLSLIFGVVTLLAAVLG